MPKKKPSPEPHAFDPKVVVARYNEVSAQLAALKKEEETLKAELFKVIGTEDDLDIELDKPYTLHRVVKNLSKTDYEVLKDKAVANGADLNKLPEGCVITTQTLTEAGTTLLVMMKKLTPEDVNAAYIPKTSEYITVKPKKA